MTHFVRRPQSQVSWDKSLVVDLDDTICTTDKSDKDPVSKYSNAVPIQSMIDRLKEYEAKGWYITIHTARHMVTCDNDAELAYKRLGDVTIFWLARNDVPYDQLVFGKPYGQLYIDDKAMLPEDFINETN